MGRRIGAVAMSIASLQAFSARLRKLASQETANKIAFAAAPKLTALVQAAFNASENPYGLSWAPGSEGQRITLRGKTGGIAAGLYYVAIGTRLRLRIAVKHAKYQLGKRRVAPSQGEELPTDYARALQAATAEVCQQAVAA
jgi:hypothetical protein